MVQPSFNRLIRIVEFTTQVILRPSGMAALPGSGTCKGMRLMRMSPLLRLLLAGILVRLFVKGSLTAS